MTVEGPQRQLAPRHRVCSLMAALCEAIGRDDLGRMYLMELMTCASDGAKQGES